MGCDKKTPCRNTTLGKPVATGMSQPWENSVATQGDPFHDPSLTHPQTLSRHRISVVTQGYKICRDRESLCRDPNRPVGLGTMSRHERLSCDTEPKSSVASLSHSYLVHCRACISAMFARPLCVSRLGRVPDLRTLSRPRTTVAT